MFEALFPQAVALGYTVYFAPLPFLQVYLCANVGPRGLLAVALPAPLVPQSASLWVPLRCHKSHPPLLPVSAPPTGLDVCFFFIYLVSDFLAFRFSVSSWLCEEAQCVYLRCHLGSPIQVSCFKFLKVFFK